MNKQLKDIKLLRCNSGNVKDILIECDSVIDDIHNRNNNHHSNIVNINKENNNSNDNDNDNDKLNDEIKQNDKTINNNDSDERNDKKIKIPFAFSIQYKNIQNMENVIWSTANTLIRKNEMTKSNTVDECNQLPDFTHDVEINQINRINELIQWRTELMKNCISSNDHVS